MATLRDTLDNELNQLRADGLYRSLRRVDSPQGTHINIGGRDLLNFSSNDYLGLANDATLKRAAVEAVERWGVGAGASRLVCGNFAPYVELETKLAAFKSKDAAIVFGSGYAANVGAITALVGEGDIVVLDKLDHASIIDGARQSGATIRVYPHKNLRKLEQLLVGAVSNRDRSGLQGHPTKRERRVLIITETIFSMDGDAAPLKEIVALKEKYGAWLMLDEAHATGVFGANRRGLAEECGVEDKIDVTLGTLSKALGCVGGFVVGSRELIDFLRNRARSLIYSTALPPAMCAAATAAVELVMNDEGARRRDRLWANVRALGAQSPIHPIIVGDETAAVGLSQKLYDQGIFVPAIRYPTVPKGKARLRVTVSASHSPEDIERLLSVVGAVSNRDRSVVTDGARIQPTPTRPTPHSSALRKNRASLVGECYFVTTCVDGRKPLLSDSRAAQEVIAVLRWLRDGKRIRLLGFVVMPDHLHVALSPCEGWTLAQVMHSLKRYTSRRIHLLEDRLENVGTDCIREQKASRLKTAPTSARHSHSDAFWQDGYHDSMLRDRQDFDHRLEYMHDNPRRLGLVTRAEDYLFSTAHPDYQKEIDWEWLEGVAVENRSHKDTQP
jgi:glycine C-acetyltransferase/8-amino-7-oxononanoate synthase